MMAACKNRNATLDCVTKTADECESYYLNTGQDTYPCVKLTNGNCYLSASTCENYDGTSAYAVSEAGIIVAIIVCVSVYAALIGCGWYAHSKLPKENPNYIASLVMAILGLILPVLEIGPICFNPSAFKKT